MCNDIWVSILTIFCKILRGTFIRFFFLSCKWKSSVKFSIFKIQVSLGLSWVNQVKFNLIQNLKVFLFLLITIISGMVGRCIYLSRSFFKLSIYVYATQVLLRLFVVFFYFSIILMSSTRITRKICHSRFP